MIFATQSKSIIGSNGTCASPDSIQPHLVARLAPKYRSRKNNSSQDIQHTNSTESFKCKTHNDIPMTFYSPLRYLGGKNKLAKFIAAICHENGITDHYVEPYAGGASVALHLLFNNYVKHITINDLDKSIYAFWYAVLHNNKKLCNRIEKTPITIENWKAAKKIQKNKNTAPLFELGFSTFFLNRTNYSGVINGGMLGGINQNGRYLIDCRFNKKELIRRIKAIGKKKDKINLRNMDAVKLIKDIQNSPEYAKTIYYFDPPYYLKGASLYMNHYKSDDHKILANVIRKIKKAKWLVTYDNVPQIIDIYGSNQSRKYMLYHSAHRIHKGREIMIFSKNLKQIPMKELTAASV